MAGSRYFNGAGAGPIRQHILSGGGRGREIRDVRRDVEAAFVSVEAEVDADRARLLANEGDISTNAGDISTLAGRVTTNEGDIAAISDWVGANVLYVGKHGLDTNTGASYKQAFLTFTAALAAAALLTPAADNRIAIICEDGGTYVENLNVPEWTGIIGHASLIQGNHIIGDNALIESFRLVATSGTCITKSAGTGSATISCERMVLTGSANGLVCTSGYINYYGQSAEAVSGIAFGNGSTGTINVNVGQTVVTGTGYGIMMTASGHMHYTGSIIAPAGTAVHIAGTAEVGVMCDHASGVVGYFVDTNATLNAFFGELTGTRTGTGTRNVTVAGELEQQSQELIFTIPLTGVTANIFNFIGEYRTVVTGQVASYATDFEVGNHHLMLLVNTLTGSGTITITGASMSEASAVPTVGDTEVITVDATGRYQSDKKWWEITDITIAGFTAVDYDIEIIGYPDLGNRNFRIIGYRMEAYAGGINPDLGFDMWKVQDDGAKKMTLVPFESIGVDANNGTNQIVDGLRTLANDRSFNPTVGTLWASGQTLCLKQTDFDSFFVSDEVTFESLTKGEGFVVRLRGEDGAGGGGISNVDFVTIWLRVSHVI